MGNNLRIKKIDTFLILLEVYKRLSRRRKKQLTFLFFLIIFNGFAELLPLASVIPFLSVITNPDLLLKYESFKKLVNFLGISQESQLILLVVLCFGFAVIFATLIRLINLWISTRLSASIGSDISCELYKRNLYKSYESHLISNSSEIINAALVHVEKTVMVINASLQLFSYFIIAIFLLTGLFIFNFSITLSLVLTFLSIYSFLGFKVRKRLVRNSIFHVNASNLQVKVLQESFGGIRDTIINGSQLIYLKIFKNLDFPMKVKNAENAFLSSFPRFALEAIGLVLIALVALLLSSKGSSEIETIIPILGTLGLGAQRLLPSMQGVYLSWATINSLSSSAKKVIFFLDMPVAKSNYFYEKTPLEFKSLIKIKNLTYKYPNTDLKVLNGINLEISKGEKIGIVGETGCGKSTLCDVLMGLLKPTEGAVYIDNKKLDFELYPERVARWKSSLAHVPQNIYLSDSTFAENIAFGIEPNDINIEKVIKAAENAKIANFIESCHEKYNTSVGEKGIRISGGQKQRIAIARAFYSNKSILFLDEATSALDSDTEKLVMESISNLKKKVTLIMIAHRKNTLSLCDRIITLHDGKIKRID